MRLDIPISVPFPEDGGEGIRAAQDGALLGAKLARMRFDYPDQMLARVAVVHGDGTFDCDRPGSDIYMRHVPTDSPELADRIGRYMTVVIRFYSRDRRKGRIVQIAGGLWSEEAVAALVWSQGQGDPNCSFIFRGSRPLWSPASVQVLDRAGCQTLGIVIVGSAIYWLYATALNEYVLEAVSIENGSTLWLATLGTAALLQRLDMCWGYLFYDQDRDCLVVLSPESDRNAWQVSMAGEIQVTKTMDYNLSQCSVRNGWVVKGWHYQSAVDAGNGNGQEDSKIRGLPIGEGEAWEFDPELAIPADLEDRAHVISSGRTFNPYSESGSVLEEGRWPMTETAVAVHVSGWQSLEDNNSNKLPGTGVADHFRCVTQLSVNALNGLACWATMVQLGLQSGAVQWKTSREFAAEAVLLTDEATQTYWSNALTDAPGRAVLLETKYARDLGSSTPPDYLNVAGIFHYQGVADNLELDRTVGFSFRAYIGGIPANGTETLPGKYQHSIGSPFLVGETVPRAAPGSYKRPLRELITIPHVRLMPHSTVHMEQGSVTFPAGEDLVDSPVGLDIRKDAPNQVVYDGDGRCYRCVQRPVPIWLGGPSCLPVWKSDEEVTGTVVTGYDDLGNAITTTTQAWQQHWDMYQVGTYKLSWTTWMECYGPEGALEWEEDISYYFEVTYQGKKVS